MHHLLELPIIRIVIWYGDGVGNERATIVVMENLRHIGFQGKFDIRYAPYSDDDTVTGDGSGEKLRTLISGFVPKNLYDPEGKYISDSGWSVLHPILGDITITRLPPPLQRFALPRVPVTISGACDNVPMIMCKKFNTEYYIQLQPTGYPARRYLAYMEDANQKEIELPNNLRLSSKALPAVGIDNALNLSISEQQVYRLCEIPALNSQLVYGIYERASCLNPVLECQRLLEAHRLLQEKDPKKIILFFPQKICMDSSFRNALEKIFSNLFWIDLTNQILDEKALEEMPNNTIVMAYTGLLQSKIFDHLMLIKTIFPPVIEGENARGLCESYGRPYLYGGRIYDNLQRYDVHIDHFYAQELHIAASRCLKKEDWTDVHLLADYMEQVITLKLESYHASRREVYLQKPDAIEYMVAKINTLLEASVLSSSITTETFEEEDKQVAMLIEILSELNKLKEALTTFASAKDKRLSDQDSHNSNRISVLEDSDICLPNEAQANPAIFIEAPSSDKIISDIKSEEAQKKEVESQERATIEDVNKTEQPINTGFMLGCCTFSVGVCISFITNRQYQNTPSENPRDFALFCGFALGAGLIVRGSSLIVHSLFAKQGTNHKLPAIAQKPEQEFTTSSNNTFLAK